MLFISHNAGSEKFLSLPRAMFRAEEISRTVPGPVKLSRVATMPDGTLQDHHVALFIGGEQVDIPPVSA